jgi:O-antigen ligase
VPSFSSRSPDTAVCITTTPDILESSTANWAGRENALLQTKMETTERFWRSERQIAFAAAYAALLFVTAVALWSCVHFGYEPALGIAAIVIGAATLVALRKWPMTMFAGLLFVGNFKTIPAHGISLSDPTMVLFLLCCGAIAIDFLSRLINGYSDWTLGTLLAGQAFRISLFILFIIVLAASFLYTPTEQYGGVKLSRFLAFETLAFFGPILLAKDEKALRPFLLATIVLSLGLLAKQIIGVWHPSQQVLQGTGDVTEIGHGMAFATSILITIYSKLINSRLLMASVLTALAVGLVTAAARTPALALVVTLIIVSFVLKTGSRHLNGKKMLLRLSLIAIVAIMAFLWVQNKPGMRDKLASKEHEVESMLSGSTREGGTIAKRMDFYNSALNAFTQHPLTGLGLGGWSVFYSGQGIPGEGMPKYPHNFLLEVASEQGLPGLALLVTLLLSLLYSSLKMAKSPEFAFLFPVLTFQVLYNAFTGTVEDRALWFWFGMVVAASRIVRNSQPLHSRAWSMNRQQVPQLAGSGGFYDRKSSRCL